MLEPALTTRLHEVASTLQTHDRSYELARELDTIRQNASEVVVGKWQPAAAASHYAAYFKRLELDLEQGTPSQLAEAVRRSPVRYALVAALDDWVAALRHGSGKEKKLLAALQAVACGGPDPWRDRFREAATTGKDLKEIKQLADEVRPGQQSPQVLRALAEQLQLCGGEPVPLLQLALAYHPRDFWLNLCLGRNCKQPAQSQGYYQAALAIRPHSVIAHNNLGFALYQQQQYKAAAANLEKAIAVNPNYAKGHNNLGNVRYEQKNYTGAMASFQTAIALDAGNGRAYNGLGNVLRDQKDYEGAVAKYKRSIELDPEYPNVYNNLGITLFALKDYQGAVGNFRQAITRESNFGAAYAKLGNAQNAVRPVSFSRNVYCNLGDALKATGDLAGAIACYQKALVIDPKYAMAANSLTESQRRVLIAQKETLELVQPQSAQGGIAGTLNVDDPLDGFPSTKHSLRKGHVMLLKAGASYQFDLKGEFDAILRIEDALQRPLLSSEGMPPAGDHGSRLVFTPAKDGPYRLIVNSAKPSQTGSYTLKMHQVSKQGQAHLQQGQLSEGGPANQGKFFQVHKARLTAGTPYVIDLESQKFDAYLILLSPNGKTTVAENDDIVPVENQNSRLDFTPQQTGEYVLQATSFRPGQTGAYTLKIQGYAPAKQDGKDRNKSP